MNNVDHQFNQGSARFLQGTWLRRHANSERPTVTRHAVFVTVRFGNLPGKPLCLLLYSKIYPADLGLKGGLPQKERKVNHRSTEIRMQEFAYNI